MATASDLLGAQNWALLPKPVQDAILADPNWQAKLNWDKALSDQFDASTLQGIDMSTGAGLDMQWQRLANGAAPGWGGGDQYQPLGPFLTGENWDYGDDRWIDGWEQPVLSNAIYDPTYGLMVKGEVANPFRKTKTNWFGDKFLPVAVPAFIAAATGYGVGYSGGLWGDMLGSTAASGAAPAAASPVAAGGWESGLANLGADAVVGSDLTGGMLTTSGTLGAPGGVMGGAGTIGAGGVTMADLAVSGAAAGAAPITDIDLSGIPQAAARAGITTSEAISAVKGAGQALSAGWSLSDILAVAGPVAGVISSVYGANLAADAAEDAAETQLAGQNAALTEMRRQFDIGQENQRPWLEAGRSSLSQLTGLMAPGGDLNRDFTLADFHADPGYQFRLSEGEQGINRAAAARGGFNSGRTLKELLRYGQGLADQTYQDAYGRWNNDRTTRYNRLAGIAGTGQTAATNMGNAGANYAGNVANTLTNGANAQAAAQIAGANARTSGYMGAANAIMGGINNWQNNQLLSEWLSRR